jgi:hypothetical protein
MTCEHDENASVLAEKARLTNPVREEFPPRIGGIGIELWVDTTEKHRGEKLTALEQALGLVQDRAGARFDGLTVYLGAPCRCIAFLGEESGNRKQILFLGDQMLDKSDVGVSEKASQVKGGIGAKGVRGIADQQYDAQRKLPVNPARMFSSEENYQKAKISAKAVAVIVHELGHLLHEDKSPRPFWALKMHKNEEGGPLDTPPAAIAQQVSQYATNNRLEFVAEVFTGAVFGTQYSAAVIELYRNYGGMMGVGSLPPQGAASSSARASAPTTALGTALAMTTATALGAGAGKGKATDG